MYCSQPVLRQSLLRQFVSSDHCCLEILFRLCHVINGGEGIGDAVVDRHAVERGAD